MSPGSCLTFAMLFCVILNLEEGPPFGEHSNGNMVTFNISSGGSASKQLQLVLESCSRQVSKLSSLDHHFELKTVIFKAPGAAKVSMVVASWLGEVIR